jgi:Na+-driven multidrug efflux pump
VLIQSTVNSYTPIIVNGNAAAANIEGFIYVAMNAFYQAAMTFVGQNLGAGNIDRIKKVAVRAVIMVSVVGLLLGGLAIILSEPLLSIYVPDSKPDAAATRHAGMIRMEIICGFYFLCGAMDVLAGVLKGMGKSVLPMAVSIIGSCALRIVWILTICKLVFPGQILWLYAAYPVSWLVTILGHLVCCIVSYRALVRKKRADYGILQ